MSRCRTVLVVLALALVASPALAHVPAHPGDNTAPERAVVVEDAAKSWSFYDRLDAGSVAYYRLTLAADQRLVVGTFTSAGGEFTPSLALLGEGIDGDQPPPGVEVPEGMGAAVIEGERPDAPSYEPFTPSANYHTVDVDRRVEAGGTYLLAVYEPRNRSGPVGVVVGYEESFSPVEYLRVGFDRVRIHQWEGQSAVQVFGPFLGTLVLGGALLAVRRRDGWAVTPTRAALAVGGLSMLGTAASVAVQAVRAAAATGPTPGVLVTAAFVAVPAAAGAWALRVAFRPERPLAARTRIWLGVAGALGLATWAGFVAGPALLVLAAIAAGR